ncbi:hypothetical protein WG66_006827 [Moniliophthora roreri]|nr:hypothetical protein WG66_006827 [Moniliophthora roreri]
MKLSNANIGELRNLKLAQCPPISYFYAGYTGPRPRREQSTRVGEYTWDYQGFPG